MKNTTIGIFIFATDYAMHPAPCHRRTRWPGNRGRPASDAGIAKRHPDGMMAGGCFVASPTAQVAAA